jgi:hypothetical protein
VRLGRIKGILAGIYVLGRPRKLFPAGPGQPSLARPASRPVVTPAGPLLFAPGWAGAIPRLGRRSLPGWAGQSSPSWAPERLPRLGRSPSHLRAIPSPCFDTRLGSVPRPLSLPGWAIVHLSGWASAPPPGWAGMPPAGLLPAAPPRAIFPTPRLGRIRRIRPGRDSLQATLCQFRLGRIRAFRLGQAGTPLARLDYLHGRPNYPSPGRDLLPPGHIPRPALTPAPCASPGTPLGSDWHILHRHILVLGCPLAQTSILPSPSQSYPQEEDKTDDMEILKTHARRQRPRTPSTDIDGTSP